MGLPLHPLVVHAAVVLIPLSVLALIAVNAGVGGLRFLSLRWWLVGRRRRAGYRPVAAAAPVTAPLVKGPIVGEPIVREPSHLNS